MTLRVVHGTRFVLAEGLRKCARRNLEEPLGLGVSPCVTLAPGWGTAYPRAGMLQVG